MRRQIEGLHNADESSAGAFPNALSLARVKRAKCRLHAQRPYYELELTVLEPRKLGGHPIVGRLYCTSKALWKFNWFLRDFDYDRELLERDEIDDKYLVGLQGVVKISRSVANGSSLYNFDGFATL